MLQQVLKDMYIDPDVLAALNEEQKKILFLKMREEQVRRWKEREEKERNGGDPEPKRTKPKSANCKNVTWLLGRDGEVSAIVMGEEEKRGIASIIKNIGGGDITQTQNVTPKIKTDNPSIQSKQGKPEETSSSLPLPVSVSDPLKSTPELKVEVKSIGPAKVMSNGPPQKCVNVRSPPTCDHAKPPAVQKTQVEDPSKKSFLMAKPDSMKPSELVRAGQVRTLKEVFNAKGGTTPASRGVKPPLPNKPRHLCPTNF